MGTRFPMRRVGAVLAAASATLMLAALPASADPVKGRAQQQPKSDGHSVNMGADDLSGMQPSLFTLKLADGSTLRVYCVEVHTNLSYKKDMVEVPWDKYPTQDSPFHKNRAKVNWVLHNGFPAKQVDDLKMLPGLGDLDEKEAISATQAAVWHFSDDVDLDSDNPTPKNADAKKDVKAFYDYLVGSSNTGIADQPTPALEINPAKVSGEAGKLVGPFKVSTNGAVKEIAKNLPEGVTLTDKDGKDIAAAAILDGTELFLKVPADAKAGAADFKLKGSSKADTGRLFVIEDYASGAGQSLIVADSSELKVEAAAKGDWKAAPVTTSPTPTTTTETPAPAPTTTPAPTPQGSDLPDTGASILVPALVGLGLVGAGAGALIYQRRRRNAA